MTTYTKQELAKLIVVPMDDDLERAEAAFKSASPEQMAKEYGCSGYTCQQILDSYRERRKKDVAARTFLDDMLRREGLLDPKASATLTPAEQAVEAGRRG